MYLKAPELKLVELTRDPNNRILWIPYHNVVFTLLTPRVRRQKPKQVSALSLKAFENRVWNLRNPDETENFVKELLRACREELKDAVREVGAYEGEVDMRLKDDTYYMVFTVRGSSGTVTYRTPVFREMDVPFMEKYKEDYIDDYREYCWSVGKKLSEIALSLIHI